MVKYKKESEGTKMLAISALIKFLCGMVLVGAPLFLSAGGFAYPNAWLFLGLLFLPMFLLGIVLLCKSPDLLRKRLRAKEEQGAQKGVVAVSGLLFVAGFVVAGLDHRFSWSRLPTWAVIAAGVLLLLSYALYAEVMRENAYLSRTIEVQADQKVVDTGLYGIVRHPMYAVTIVLFWSIPIVLGSLWALLCFLPYLFVIAVRIQNEEKMLSRDLAGYTDYQKKVKYRLFPWIW